MQFFHIVSLTLPEDYGHYPNIGLWKLLSAFFVCAAFKVLI